MTTREIKTPTLATLIRKNTNRAGRRAPVNGRKPQTRWPALGTKLGTSATRQVLPCRLRCRRLRRVAGQVRGLVRMVEEKRYCVDILTQLRAARAALRRVEEGVLREHVEHCVAEALRGGDEREQRDKVEELLAVIGRFG